MAYLIQGFFFQGRSGLGVRFDTDIGARAVIVTVPDMQFMYAGAIWEEDGELTGLVRDEFGYARLSEISISDSEIAFTKKYEGRNDLIFYKFGKKDGNSWIGEYTGRDSGKGVTRLFLTEIPDDFLLAEPVKKLLAT